MGVGCCDVIIVKIEEREQQAEVGLEYQIVCP